jgi:DUF971 family protein
MTVIKPLEITLNREQGFLAVRWNDDKQCQYPLSELREACPCVECRGGHHNMGLAKAPDILALKPARSYKVERVEAVGQYALQFFWDDGHHTGIYTWEYLHKICPQVKEINE